MFQKRKNRMTAKKIEQLSEIEKSNLALFVT